MQDVAGFWITPCVSLAWRMKNRDTNMQRAAAIFNFPKLILPSEVSECLVGVGHTVGVLPLGVSSTFLLECSQKFVSQL